MVYHFLFQVHYTRMTLSLSIRFPLLHCIQWVKWIDFNCLLVRHSNSIFSALCVGFTSRSFSHIPLYKWVSEWVSLYWHIFPLEEVSILSTLRLESWNHARLSHFYSPNHKYLVPSPVSVWKVLHWLARVADIHNTQMRWYVLMEWIQVVN